MTIYSRLNLRKSVPSAMNMSLSPYATTTTAPTAELNWRLEKMTNKEKLTALQAESFKAYQKFCAEHECATCPYRTDDGYSCMDGFWVDFMLDNGVTVLDCNRDCKNCYKTKLVNPPQREPGRWIEHEHDDGWGRYILLHCDKCDQMSAKPLNFCPNCGAPMIGGNGNE